MDAPTYVRPELVADASGEMSMIISVAERIARRMIPRPKLTRVMCFESLLLKLGEYRSISHISIIGPHIRWYFGKDPSGTPYGRYIYL